MKQHHPRCTQIVRPGDSIPLISFIRRFGLYGIAIGQLFFGYNSHLSQICTGKGWIQFHRRFHFPYFRIRTYGQMVRFLRS